MAAWTQGDGTLSTRRPARCAGPTAPAPRGAGSGDAAAGVGAGPTVLISPLLALMRNQIAAAERLGIRAVTVNSTNREDWDAVREQLGADGVDLLLISPERLNNPQF